MNDMVLQGKKILIIGSTSTVGRSVGCLLEEENKVYYAGRQKSDFYFDLNSSNFKSLNNLKIDVVIHAAADFGGNSEDDIIRTEIVNAIGSLRICRLVEAVKANHLLLISTISALYRPGDPYYNIYSLSKRHAEDLSQLYCNMFDIPLTILRPSQLYDSESKCRTHQGLFFFIIDRAQKGEDIFFFGNNDALRNYLYLDDFSEIISRVIQNKITGVYNCVAQKHVQISEIARLAYHVFRQNGKVHFLTNKPDIPDLPSISSNELYKKIGFQPSVSLLEGIRLIKKYREMIS